ncbi:hypothetical protein JCM10295v2_001034 [Rhodotorula toruloides]
MPALPLMGSLTARAPYTLLATWPSSADPDSSSAFVEKRDKLAHSRSISLNGIGSGFAPEKNIRRRRLAGLLVATAGVAGLVVLLLNHLPAPPWRTGQGELQYTARHRIAVDFETTAVPEDWSCNPFKEPGRLEVDVRNKFKNIWRPFDEACPPSKLMEGVVNSVEAMKKAPRRGFHKQRGPRRSHDTSVRWQGDKDERGQFYPWLVNATIVLLGDSMERLHLSEFCDFVGGDLQHITPRHPASPPLYRKKLPTLLDADGNESEESKRRKEERRKNEDEWEFDRVKSWNITRPWVCDIKEYGATIVSSFHWGLEDLEDAFESEDFFHGPSTFLQRFFHKDLPLIEKLAEHFDRPSILQPTVIEVASGYWDLRQMTEEDFIQAGITRPYPTDDDRSFGPIGEEREARWRKHMVEVIKEIAKAFPGSQGVRDGPVISWRTMHHPKRNNYTPYSRVAPLDALARKTMHDLRVSSLATSPAFRSNSGSLVHSHLPPEALQEIERISRELGDADGTDYGFDERIRVDEVGKLLEGQENHFRDFLHPDALPGSYLWSDIILYEVKRAYYRIGRSTQELAAISVAS